MRPRGPSVCKIGILPPSAAARTSWAFAHPGDQPGRAKDKGDAAPDHISTRREEKEGSSADLAQQNSEVQLPLQQDIITARAAAM